MSLGVFFAAVSPYWGKDFWGFFSLFFHRIFLWVKGDLPFDQFAADEIQLLVLLAVTVSSSLVGSFLVLRRMAMLANSLSHTILLGIVSAYLLTFAFSHGKSEMVHLHILLIASLITGLLTTFLTQLFTQKFKLQEDASIGLVFTTLFALGIILVTLFTRNMHLGIEAIMGNVDALHPDDLKLACWIAAGDILLVILFFKELKITAFDPSFASTLGISPSIYHYLLMVMCAATCIGAFRAVGVLLVLALLVGPTLTARLFTSRLPSLLFASIGIGSVSAIAAVALSRHILSVYHTPLSTSGLVVALLAFSFVLGILFSPKQGIATQLFKRVWWKKQMAGYSSNHNRYDS